MNISEILSTSLGSFTIGEALSALFTLLVCLLIIRTVMKVVPACSPAPIWMPRSRNTSPPPSRPCCISSLL